MSEISDKRKLLRTLKEIKENLSWEYDKEYNKIWNACAEIDNEYGEPYLCDYISEENYVQEDEIMEFLIKSNSDSLDRLRCFIGDTYSADLYRVDGYGNFVSFEERLFKKVLSHVGIFSILFANLDAVQKKKCNPNDVIVKWWCNLATPTFLKQKNTTVTIYLLRHSM